MYLAMQQTEITITVTVLVNIGVMVLVFVIRQNRKIVGIGILITSVTRVIAIRLFGIGGFVLFLVAGIAALKYKVKPQLLIV